MQEEVLVVDDEPQMLIAIDETLPKAPAGWRRERVSVTC